MMQPSCWKELNPGVESTQTWTKAKGFLKESVIPSFSHLLTLNSSEISDMKEEICFMSRSMLLSLPVFSSVVMARVAMLRLESVTRFSRSKLQAVTADGCFMATYRRRQKAEKPLWLLLTDPFQ